MCIKKATGGMEKPLRAMVREGTFVIRSQLNELEFSQFPEGWAGIGNLKGKSPFPVSTLQDPLPCSSPSCDRHNSHN